MIIIISKLLEELEQGRDAVLATIVERHDSAPRGAGAMMLVGASGLLAGTIGGGGMELRSVRFACRLLEQRRSALEFFSLRAGDPEGVGVCGGDLRVLFQYIPADDGVWRSLAAELLERLEARRGGYLALSLSGGTPLLSDEAPEAGEERLFCIPLLCGERAVIFGAGHCARALAPLLRSVGFRVTVFDDRADYADPVRFPAAEYVICGDYENISASLTLTGEDYIVVMTQGHGSDFTVLEQALRVPPVYTGVIGSAKKAAVVNRRLRESGHSDAMIAQIHSPVGMAIRAETPEEIAVSIAGEMILERARLREELS